jgi:hypothetical protein
MTDLSKRLSNRVQISSDSLRSYVDAVERASGADVEYGQIVKFYDAEPIGPSGYAPPRVTGVERTVTAGNPDQAHISTSHVERQKFDDAYEHVPVYVTDERFQQEARKPSGGGCPAFCPLQTPAAAQDLAHHARNGGGRDRSAMVARGIGGADVKFGRRKWPLRSNCQSRRTTR